MKILLSAIAVVTLLSLVFTTGDAQEPIVFRNGNSPIVMSNSDNARFDMDGDNKADIYFKAHQTGNFHQKLKVDYKFQDECVDLGPKDPSDVGGDTFDDAAMKIGFSTIPTQDRDWTIDDVKVTNSWFNSKKNDANRQIDLATFPNGFIPSELPLEGNGDDVIQGDGKKGAFKHMDSISELHDQSGWSGTIFVDGPVGDYVLWTLHPSGGFGGCDGLSGFGIILSITE